MTALDVAAAPLGDRPFDRLSVVVTGAGSGLGRALARSLAGHGHNVVLVGRRAPRLADVRAECLAAGASADSCLVFAGDVAAPETGQRLVHAALDAWGAIDALVNNAAVARFGAVDALGIDDAEAVVRTNLLGPMAMIRAALPALREAKGSIINVGSIGGLLSLPGRSAYGASKAALHHLTRSLAKELAPDVRVNAVVPGAIDTEIYEDLRLTPEQTAALRAELVRTTPLGRMGMPADVVPWTELLLGPAGSWMTGSLIVVDGGRSC